MRNAGKRLNFLLLKNKRRPAPRQSAAVFNRYCSNGSVLFHTTFPPGLDELVVVDRLALGFLVDLGLG